MGDAPQTAHDSSTLRRARMRLVRDSRTFVRWLAGGPVSVFLSLLLLTVFIVSISIGREDLEPHIAAGVGHSWWTVFTAISWSHNAIEMIIDIVLLLSVGIWIERVMGSGWFILIGAISYWFGAFLTILIAEGIDSIDPAWGDLLEQQEIVGIAAFLIGVGSAAAVKLPALWRRRVRTMVVSILLVMLAFAGTLGTIFTLVTTLLGTILGIIIWHKSRDRAASVMAGPQQGRGLVAIVVAGIVIGTLISLRSPEMIGALSSMKYTVASDAISPDIVDQMCAVETLSAQCAHYSYLLRSGGAGARLLALMPLVTQLVLAWGLRGGRLAAWWGTVILQSLTAVVALVHMAMIWGEVKNWEEGSEILGFNELGLPTARFIVPIVVPLVLLIIVCAKRSLFTVRAGGGTYEKAGRTLGVITALTLLVSLIIGVSIGATKTFLSTVWILTTDFLIRLLPSSVLSLVTPQMAEESEGAIILMSWAPLIPWAALIVLLWRSFRRRDLPNSISRAEYIEIVRSTNAGSLGWITTWEGNNYWKSSHYDAAIAYRSDGGVALTVSDPAVRNEDLADVLEEFVSFAVGQGLIPAFYSVHGPVIAITDAWRWSRLQVAEETLLVLNELEFKGKKFQDIRTALNRARKEGISTHWTTFAECKPAYMAQIKQISAEWVSDKPLPEMGFTLGGVAELDDPDTRILLAIDDDDTVHGITSWMPIYEDGRITGWTLDFMRRLGGGFRPVMEYLIASAALWAKENNYEILSLSGAPLARAKGMEAEKGSSAQILDQVLEVLGQTLEPVYGFRSLLNFKSKFNPEYAPIYLAVPSIVELPTVGLAIAHAYLPSLTLKDTITLGTSLRQK